MSTKDWEKIVKIVRRNCPAGYALVLVETVAGDDRYIVGVKGKQA